MSALKVLSEIIGWLYFLFWASSFYGQIYENQKLRSVEGMSFEFVGLNLTGFLFYAIYNSVYYFDHSFGVKIDIQDIIFAYNAVIAIILTIVQAFMYPHGKNKLQMWCVYLIMCLWIFTILMFILSVPTDIYKPSSDRSNVYSMMGYEKLLISFIKYMPQVYWNYKRKSTVGWSIFNILCDFAGGLLSFMQIVLESIDSGNLIGTDVFDGSLNVVKFLLSLIAMGFDIIFLVQHYILYPTHKRKDNLLNEETAQSMQESGNNAIRIVPIESQSIDTPMI